MDNSEHNVDECYEAFQNPNECRKLVRMLLHSGLLSDILSEIADYVKDEEDKTHFDEPKDAV